ncbi:hypothetical protein TYRP_018928 [Tyrophagus putrescentiae]|nr:hypothetical protein TYRP_018928 [Tyrophagus putrescentiae]
MKFRLLLAVVSFIGLAGTTTYADQCQACKSIFNFVSKVTHNADENVKGQLADLCSEYSMSGKQAKSWCLKSVDAFFNVMNKNLNTSTVCYDINACIDENDNGIRELQNIEGKEDCDFCVFVTTKVKEILSGSPTEIEIKTILEDGCHSLGSFEKECLSLTDDYVDQLVAFINTNFQPRQLCKSLNVCAARTGPLSPVNTVLLPSATDLANVLPLNITLDSETETEVKSPVSDINCDICKKLVKIIQAQLKDNATDQEILNVLTEVCDLAPSSDRQSCKTVVADYTKRLIQVLTQDIDSNLACTMVGLCVPQSFLNYINGHYVKKPELPTVDRNVVCVECQLITHFLQNELYNYKNEEQIEEFLMNHFCKKVSWYINENSCDNFVQQYGPIIMQTIAQEVFDPTTFCFKEIHVCPRTKFTNDFTSNHHNDRRCQMCQDIVNNLNQVGSQDLELDPLIEKSCDTLPQAHRVECALMMKAFGPYFFDVINHQDNAKEICKSIDICFTPGNVHLLGGHKCTFGPSYWCHTAAHANACNAHDYCSSKVWKPINN